MQVSVAATESRRAGLTMVAARGLRDVIAAGSVAALAADVPFGDGLGLDVVVHRMAAIAQRAGGALHVVGGVEGHPPIGVIGDEIGAPDLMRDVPLRAQRKIIVADFREVALLPDAAVDQRDVFFLELDQRVGLGEVGQDGFGMLLGIAHHVRHGGFLPARVDGGVAGFAGGGTDVSGSGGEQRRERAGTEPEELSHVPYFSLVSLVGCDCSQAMESVTPEAMPAQAFEMAVRMANASVEPDAVRQLVWPLKVMQAS